MIEFKAPDPAQVNAMKEYAEAVERAFAVVESYQPNHVTRVVFDKLQESLQWFQSGLLNGVLAKNPPPAAPVDPQQQAAAEAQAQAPAA